MKIVFFEMEPWERKEFKELEQTHDVLFVEEPLKPHKADQYTDAEVISTFIYSDLSEETLKYFPRLKMVATRSTGYDHIDLTVCKERNITVHNVPTYGENTVAEHVFALLLTITHKMIESIERTRSGEFSFEGLRGSDIAGKTMGIIGMGSIGRHTKRIAEGFGMNVLCHAIEAALGTDSLEKVLKESDVISLHVPSNKQTYHMISDSTLNMMKEGVILINTARGNVIDVKALLKALSSGKVGAVGLDVLPEEPLIREEAELWRTLYYEKHNLEELLADHILLRRKNVYVTPHNAFNTQEAILRILKTTQQNILTGSNKVPL